MVLNQLQNLGLSENEARVYLAMLELGPATMLQISTRAEVNRPTAYVQIEHLKKLGLVSTQTKGKKQFFIAENPDQLASMLEKERETIEQKKNELGALLPELDALFRLADSKPQVRFFEGREGLVRISDEFLKSGATEVLAISAFDDVLKLFPEHSHTNASERVKRGIHSKFVYTTQSEEVKKAMASSEAMLRESRFIPPEKFPISFDLSIYGNSVSIRNLKNRPFGVIIVHKDIADSFRGMFNLIWNMADKI